MIDCLQRNPSSFNERFMIPCPPPATRALLMARAQALEGYTLQTLAKQCKTSIPNLQRAKGWAGQFLEKILGATSGSLPQPDFPHLGIELKTIPVDLQGYPLESTYVCTAPLPFHGTSWQSSIVRLKLQTVLWLPIHSEGLRIGKARLWDLDPTTELQLRRDWELLTEKLRLGQFQGLSANLGEILQLRPKAENHHQRIKALTQDLEQTWVNPRGFYLRRSFTSTLLKDF